MKIKLEFDSPVELTEYIRSEYLKLPKIEMVVEEEDYKTIYSLDSLLNKETASWYIKISDSSFIDNLLRAIIKIFKPDGYYDQHTLPGGLLGDIKLYPYLEVGQLLYMLIKSANVTINREYDGYIYYEPMCFCFGLDKDYSSITLKQIDRRRFNLLCKESTVVCIDSDNVNLEDTVDIKELKNRGLIYEK